MRQHGQKSPSGFPPTKSTSSVFFFAVESPFFLLLLPWRWRRSHTWGRRRASSHSRWRHHSHRGRRAPHSRRRRRTSHPWRGRSPHARRRHSTRRSHRHGRSSHSTRRRRPTHRWVHHGGLSDCKVSKTARPKSLLPRPWGCMAVRPGPPTPRTGPAKPMGAAVIAGTAIPRPLGMPLPGPAKDEAAASPRILVS